MERKGFGAALRAKRKQAGLSQMDLANNSGVDQSTISLLERGKRPNTQVTTLAKLADALGWSLGEWQADAGEASAMPSGRVLTFLGMEIPVVTPGHAGEFNTSVAGRIGTLAFPVPDLFAAEVRGDCLTDLGITDGDFLIFNKRARPKNGDVVYARVHDEHVIRRFYARQDHVELRPANGRYKSLRRREVVIEGVMEWQVRAAQAILGEK